MPPRMIFAMEKPDWRIVPGINMRQIEVSEVVDVGYRRQKNPFNGKIDIKIQLFGIAE